MSANLPSGYQNVQHHPDQKRFELHVGNQKAYSEYMKVGDTYIFTHTEVPEGLEGQGVGGNLVKGALEIIKENKESAAPLCPFVKAYIERHPEYKSLVKLG